jgi:hypothetical protein
VHADRGATVTLEECIAAYSSEGSSLGVEDKGTCVKARKSTFRGNGSHGPIAESEANVQLHGCTAVSNKDHNVLVGRRAAVGLVGCIIADSLTNAGLYVVDKGTFTEAINSTFRGKFVGACLDRRATLQLDG